MTDVVTVLGIETSCDETAAAVVERSAPTAGRILSNVIRSQWEQHRPYGGVVPEIAARAHVECLDEIIREALARAATTLAKVDAVAAAAGPGLVGGLMVGVTTAKAIALATGKPFVAVNHLEAHALTVGLTDGVVPPYLLLLISGGHTQLVAVDDIGRYCRLGTTIDDAVGEAFDKTAKLLGLGMPGGPQVERRARTGNPDRFPFPRPMTGRPEPNFSFAGLKTAVRQTATALSPLTDAAIADLCASFEAAVVGTVCDRIRRALPLAFPDATAPPTRRLVVAGGVAANQRLRLALQDLCDRHHLVLTVPPPALCTDNAAMIAWTGAEHLVRGTIDGLDAAVRARWPLDETVKPLIGFGRLGAKA